MQILIAGSTHTIHKPLEQMPLRKAINPAFLLQAVSIIRLIFVLCLLLPQCLPSRDYLLPSDNETVSQQQLSSLIFLMRTAACYSTILIE